MGNESDFDHYDEDAALHQAIMEGLAEKFDLDTLDPDEIIPRLAEPELVRRLTRGEIIFATELVGIMDSSIDRKEWFIWTDFFQQTRGDILRAYTYSAWQARRDLENEDRLELRAQKGMKTRARQPEKLDRIAAMKQFYNRRREAK